VLVSWAIFLPLIVLANTGGLRRPPRSTAAGLLTLPTQSVVCSDSTASLALVGGEELALTRNVGLLGGQSPSACTEGAGIAAKLRLGDLAILGGPPGFAQPLHFGRPNTALKRRVHGRGVTGSTGPLP